MKKNKEWKRRLVAVLLCVTMLVPDMAPILAEAATAIGNQPRRVDFTRPEALRLEELGISTATGSNIPTAAGNREGNAATATGSNASGVVTATDSDIREPEEFYELPSDEPDGILVQFDETRNIRTYQQGETEFVTVIGGYSGLYRDVDGKIRSVDNRILKTGGNQDGSVSIDDDEEDDDSLYGSGDVELVNDLTFDIPSESGGVRRGLAGEVIDEDRLLPRKALARKEKTEDRENEQNTAMNGAQKFRAAAGPGENPGKKLHEMIRAKQAETAGAEETAETAGAPRATDSNMASGSTAPGTAPSGGGSSVSSGTGTSGSTTSGDVSTGTITSGTGGSKKATPSNAETVTGEAYYNQSGPLDVCLPEKMDRKEGYTISDRRDALEVIPLEGDYSRSSASGNMVRYSSVFPSVDIQYTVLGSTVKEDIILLDRQDRNSFSYQLKSDTLKFKKDGDTLLAYRDTWHRPKFALTAPVMVDAEGNTSTAIRLAYRSPDKTITYTADREWLDAPERAYPVRLDPAGAVLVDYSAFTLNMVAKGGPHLGTPGASGKYFGTSLNPMAGFSEDYGYCRAMIQVNPAWETLMGSSDSGTGQEPGSGTEGQEPGSEETPGGPDSDEDGVKDVELVLHTVTKDATNNTGFALFVASKPWDPATVTWDSMKRDGVDAGMTQTGDIAMSSANDRQKREMTFNVTDTYYRWVKEPATRTGFVLQAYVEGGDQDYIPGTSDVGSVSWAETFYNHTGGTEFGPCLRVAWQGRLENASLKTMEMSEFDVDVDPAMAESPAGGRTTLGVVAHGVSQEGSTIEYRFVEEESGVEADAGETTAGDSAAYADFTEVDPECLPAAHLDSNWQSKPTATVRPPLECNRIYYVEAKGTGKNIEEDEEGNLKQGDETVETEWIRKEENRFLLYEVQATDILPRIARHYGVDTKVLQHDNQFGYQLVEAGNILFIRNPVTDEPYTMPLDAAAMEEFIKYCLMHDLDPRCMVGGEPVNLSTGGFYMERSDASLKDLDGEFAITRSYSGLHPYFRSEFGMGWNSPIGERIMVLPDGTILYTTGSGKGIVFEKDGSSYKAPEGYDYELKAVDTVDYPEGSGTPEDGEEEDGEEAESRKLAARAAKSASRAAAGSGSAEADATGSRAAGTQDSEDTDSGESAEKVSPSDGWEITEPDGTVRTFNHYGLLLTKKNRKGHTTSYIYDSDYLLTEITSPSGKSFGVTMEPDGKITEIVLPDGGTLAYEYDDSDNLTAFTDQEGSTVRYEYDADHRMTAWYDENGNRVIENVLDSQGRVVEQTDALGSIMTFTYSGTETAVTDNNGHTTVYKQDDQMRNVAVDYANGDRESSAYSEDNRLESRTDANGATTRYTYDKAGNILSVTRDDGSRASYTYNEYAQPLTAKDYEGNTTRFTYDEKGNLLSMTDGEGSTTRYGYDDLSRIVSMTDANGSRSRFAYDGDEAVARAYTDGAGNTSHFTYDAMNRVLTETDPEGNTTEHTYNARGWETATTAADGGVTAYAFSPAGEVLSITDPMGVETTFTYDAQHNILSGEDALGNTLSYEYDGNYNRISETNAKGDTTAYRYDERNRLVETTDALGNSTTYTLDGMGNILSTTDRRGSTSASAFDPVLNLPVSSTDALGNETGYTHDRNGNLTEIHYPDGTSVSYAYDRAGRLAKTVAQNGLETVISYDGNGNIVRVTDDETRVYRFTYDGCSRLVEAVDPLGGVQTYAYDRAGRQIRTTDENSHGTGYTYDAVGRLKEITDALGGTVSRDYDLNGRTLSVTDQNRHTTTWHYDVLGQVLAEVDAAGNVTAMEYDSLGNVAKTTDALKGETSLEVDALSRTTRITDALGGVYRYSYDENGNLTGMSMPDGDTVSVSYDEADRMASYQDEAGVVTTYEYDSMGRITKAEDSTGNVMHYEYDACGNLAKQTDTMGREAVYVYDRFNRLASVTGTDQATTAYTYDALDRLTSVTQADGTVTTYEYDSAGNLVKTTEPGEAVWIYAYDAINRLTEKVNPLGAATTFQYDPKGNLTGSTDAEGTETSYAYDALDRLVVFTDGRGSDTRYGYDELSRLISHTTPEGSLSEYRYDALSRLTKAKDPNGLITEYQYDPMGNLVKEISPRGAETSYTYDRHDELTSITDHRGNVTSYTVDLNRQVTELTQKNGGTYTYTYDAVHRLTGITTPLGLEKEFTYDTADNLVRETDNLGRTTTYAYDIMHRMTEAVNAKDGKTTFGYDIRGNRNAVTDAMGYTWNYRYDLVDQLTEGTDPEGKATEAVYDLVGNITSITRPGDRTTRYTYDRNYNQTTMTDPKGYVYRYTYDRDSRLVGTADPLQQTESTTYDAGSRVTAVRDKMELTESYTYDAHGNVTTRKATDGLVTRFSYDILDNLVAVTDPMNRRTTYTYDSMGNVTSVTDAKLQVTKYTYDLENNLTGRTTPMGRTEEYVRDVAGRLTQRTTPSGNAIHYDYDTLNSLVEKTYHNTGELGNDHPVQMGYNEMGQRVSMEDITGESSYTYDGLGRLKTATNGSGKTVTYEYDEADNLGAIIYPDGKSVHYGYDKNDNITKLTDRDGRETVFSYDPINRLTKVVRADGSESAYTYNARNQVLSVENTCVCGFLISSYQYTYGDSGLVTKEVAKECLFASDKDYGHKGGSREECAHVPANPWENQNPVWETTTRTFTYDDNGQLLRCDESKSQFDKTTYTYTYDEAGNRISAKKEKLYSYLESWQATYTYNADNQMVTAKKREGNLTKTYTFQYDANGNLTKECFRNCAEVTYQYDTENRLAAVYDQQKLRMAAVYDGDGNRAFQLNYNPEAKCGYGMNVSGEIFMPEHSVEEDGSLTAEGQLFSYICSKTGRAYDLTEYVNDTNRPYTEVLAAYNINSGTDRESYTYAGQMRVSKNRFWNEARDLDHDEMGYYLYDGRGSVTANTWYNGMVTAVYQYDPYGQVEYGSTEHTDFYGYNGESYNPNTGLVYLRARYYNAEQGRFFQEDTYPGSITDPLTQNRYAYVKNSPLNYTDPSGHKASVLAGGSSRQITESGISLFGGNSRRKEREEQKAAALEAIKAAMEIAEDTGCYKACVISIVRYTLIDHGINPDEVRGKIESWLLPMEWGAENFQNRVREYLRYLYGTDVIPNTQESYQVALTVYDILVDQILYGGSLDDIRNEDIDYVFADYLFERVEEANRLVGVVTVIGIEVARQLVAQRIYDLAIKEIMKAGNPNLETIIDGLKDAEVIYKKNPVTGQMEPYMKQYQVNDDYKVLFRRDFDGFNDHDAMGNHWNLEVQTIGGRTVYDLHVYVDVNGNILPITENNIYIPKKSPFNKK